MWKNLIFCLFLLFSITNLMSKNESLEKAAFGAGCFWGVEENFRNIKGVVHTAVGYMGGMTKNPTYEQVCTDATGHAEVVYLEFDPKQTSYEELLKAFWNLHDPTQFNRQGPDIGKQYRSVVFYYTPEQKHAAEKMKRDLEASKKFQRPIVTEITEAPEFYKAEEYHQQYLQKRGLSSCKIH
jgi:peptide-methionine (S)-S-oxide reductase